MAATGVLWPVVLRDRKKQEIDDELHLFIIRIGVLSLSSSTRSSIYEIAAKEKSSKAVLKELEKVKILSREWNIALPNSLRVVAKQTPSDRFGDFLERMAYAIESDEDPKVFFRNEQEAVMEEFKSRYSTTLDRIEVIREVYISMISVTMFLNVMLVILSLLVGINHYLMSFLVVFIFIVVELVLWVVVNQTLPSEHIWYDPKPRPRGATFHRKVILWTLGASGVSATLALIILSIGFDVDYTLFYIAIVATPFLVPGMITLREEMRITRRDDAFGAFIRTLGATVESKVGTPTQGLKRLRWHDFGELTGQVKNLYDRLMTRIDSEKSWDLFVQETKSELISQFLNTYHEGIRAGGRPKEVASLVSNYFTSLASLRKRRYLMADNFAAILYGLTVFISAGMFMIHSVVVAMLSKLNALETTSTEVESLQSLVLLKDVAGLETILLAAIIIVILLHVIFSADAARSFRGSHPRILMIHTPALLWTAAISGWLAKLAVGTIL
jgi:flagellar protein FlaJ